MQAYASAKWEDGGAFYFQPTTLAPPGSVTTRSGAATGHSFTKYCGHLRHFIGSGWGSNGKLSAVLFAINCSGGFFPDTLYSPFSILAANLRPIEFNRYS
ncbi:MAG: hypothetical protein LBF24_01805 [Puniceicoccales bacterium]|jgi:hypothetical protein|nr:hypothetical protein [Puniceicoccales bacterium]